jgi:lipopolysaccharide biosynthesis protein
MKAICFYLPQYHPIPENDAWWGRGFTEWTNVAAARPLFRGHHQPHIPGELGFYDLRLEESRLAQAALAAEHGISAFCYYHYWFNGTLLLERPFDEVLRSGRPDLPFCLCWANGNWNRAWDGRDHEVLMGQDYSAYDAEAHLRWLAPAFGDPRYLRVHGRPLFLIYDPASIPDLPGVIAAWRRAAGRQGLADPYLCGVLGPGSPLTAGDLERLGFDAAVDFHPKGYRAVRGVLAGASGQASIRLLRRIRAWVRSWLPAGSGGPSIQSYRATMEAATARPVPESVFPCVMPGWDNTPRRGKRATIIQNDDPALYAEWLRRAASAVRHRPEDEQLVFINAWNEWGEGCHLEPDLRHGRAFLEATRAALRDVRTAPAPRAGRPDARAVSGA